jgi:hypothetical protein
MRYLASTVLKFVVLGLCMVTFYSEQTTFAESKERIVHFPEERSM